MNAPPTVTTARILSLDVFRGFVMFWIIGADGFGEALREIPFAPARFVGEQLSHTTWVGLTFYDLIFPSFVLMVGMSIPFSLDRLRERHGNGEALARVGRRVALLFALGLLYYGGLSGGFAKVRLLGVLQRLALCYGAASCLYLWLPRRGVLLSMAGLLIGYWVLMTWVPVPGFGPGDYARGHNLANWIDQQFLPGRLWYGDYDPEGLLSTLPAIASCLIGLEVGRRLKSSGDASANVRWLVSVGVILLIGGYFWSLECPIIKRVWTPSYALVSAGWGVLLFSLFYALLDVRFPRRGWYTPFVWIGSNALTIYLISHVVDFNKLSSSLVGGPVSDGLNLALPGLGGLVVVFVGTLLCVLLCGFLHRNRIFLRV